MKPAISYRLKQQQFWLSADRVLFWEDERALIIADLHFGKTGHFRKSGLAVPQSLYREDLQRLVAQIQYFQPGRLIIVGDFFHSQKNREMELFQKWRENFLDLQILLVKGNHDILEASWYLEAGIQVVDETLKMGHFEFVHDIAACPPLGAADNQEGQAELPYFFSGHIHPGIRVNGQGRQSLCFPCFYFGAHYAVLPAFSRFTGLASISPGRKEHVFAIVEDQILQIQ